MPDPNRMMSLGLSIFKLGYHVSAWRMPEFPKNALMNADSFTAAAQAAERAKLDFIFFADTLAVKNIANPTRDIAFEHFIVKLDPVVALSVIAAVTERIGLIGTISTTYADPYSIARAVASLDLVSGGRAGWNVVTSYGADERANFGLDAELPQAARYARAHEAVDVVKGLWRSWDSESFPQDKRSGLYLDRNRMRTLDHKGQFFSVRGPLDVGHSPQGRPVIVSAGDSEAAQDLAAKYAEIQYAPTQGRLDRARRYYAAVKSRMSQYGRTADELRILPGLMPIVGETEGEAERKIRHARSLIHPATGLALLQPLFGDLSGFPIDGPFPSEDQLGGGSLSEPARNLLDRARGGRLSIRQTYEIAADGENWFMTSIGTVRQMADLMEEWFTGGAADGFNILPHYMPGGSDDFIRLVVPELQRRRLFRTEYPGRTLRDTLGLKVPEI